MTNELNKQQPAATTEPVFTVEHCETGYANVRLSGTYTGTATAEDVRKRFYHSYFGGRDEWAKDGKFGVVVHTD